MYCTKCLLRDLSDEQIYKSVTEYISLLDESEKTGMDEYERRLAVCRLCDNLINGMCRLCGCFVEARAAKARQQCPDAEKKW